jgi:hypothetical protein
MHQYNLKSIVHINDFIRLLNNIEDESFVDLNQIEKVDRELREGDDWNDQIHEQFTTQYILTIQKYTYALQKSLYDARQELNRIKNIYSQIM